MKIWILLCNIFATKVSNVWMSICLFWMGVLCPALCQDLAVFHMLQMLNVFYPLQNWRSCLCWITWTSPKCRMAMKTRSDWPSSWRCIQCCSLNRNCMDMLVWSGSLSLPITWCSSMVLRCSAWVSPCPMISVWLIVDTFRQSSSLQSHAWKDGLEFVINALHKWCDGELCWNWKGCTI